MNEYQVSIISSLSQFDKMAKSWDELLAKSSSNNIFLTWEWQFSWAESFLHKYRQLFVIPVYKKDELVAIAPWYIRQTPAKGFLLNEIEFLGTPESDSDYLDVFIKKGHEKGVTEALYQFLFKEGASFWDSLMLKDIPANSLFLLHLLNKIEEDGKYCEITKGSFCPFTALPKDKETFISSLSANRREQFRRHLKILKGLGNVEHRTFWVGDTSPVLDEFFSLSARTNSQTSNLLKPFIEKFISRCENKKWVQIDLLTANQKNISGFLHLHYGSTIYMYLMAVDKTFHPKISLGNILVGLSIENAIEQGFSIYDFLKGTEHYKFHWMNGLNTSLNIFLIQRKPIPIIMFLARLLKYGAKLLFR